MTKTTNWLTALLITGIMSTSSEGDEPCCFNGSLVTVPGLCEWLEASGGLSQESATIPCPCSPTYCLQSLASSVSTDSVVPMPATLAECWNTNATEYVAATFLTCPQQAETLWGGAAAGPQPRTCCYLSQYGGGQAQCTNVSTMECTQLWGGIALDPGQDCDACLGTGACLTGVESCTQTLMTNCQPFPSASRLFRADEHRFDGLGGWKPSTSCVGVNESIWEFFAGEDCTGESVLASQRSIFHNYGEDEIDLIWNTTVTFDGLPIFWFKVDQIPRPTLPRECFPMAANNISVVVNGLPCQSVRLYPNRSWSQLFFVWEVALSLLVSIACLPLAIVAERRWRWLRTEQQPTANLIRTLALFLWIAAARNAAAAVMPRQNVLSQAGELALAITAAVLTAAADLAFSFFLVLFARRVQQERDTYTKKPWRRYVFFFTQTLPLLVLPPLSLSALSFVSMWDTQTGLVLGLMAFGTLVGMIGLIIVGVRLSLLVRYTMRVLPFRQTGVLTAWLLATGVLFGFEHFALAIIVAERNRRAWTGFFLPLGLAALPGAAAGWLLLLWPPLNHAVSLVVRNKDDSKRGLL